MPSNWLESPDWQAVQGVWLALLNLAEYPTEAVPWDLLRLHVDRHLNCLQRLVLSKAMRVDEQRQIEDLVQARFDQALEQLNRQRQQQKPYWVVAPDHYRGNFSRFQAMGDLEQRFNETKTELELSQVPRQIRFQALHDLNLELMEKYLLRQPVEQKPLLWRAALEHTILLSWSETYEEALTTLMSDLSIADASDLAHRVLKSSRFLQAQRSAVRVLARDLPQVEIVETFQQILNYSETPDSLILEILQALPAQLTWEPVLLDLLEDLQRDSSELRHVLLNKWQQLESPRQSQRLLSIFQSARGWQARTRCLAIHALARHGVLTAMDQVSAILQEAARADDTRLLQLAAETLVLFNDTRAVPYLLSALNGQYRQQTRLEKLSHAFASEQQDQLPILVSLLEKLGQEIHFDRSSGLWKIQQ